MRKLWKALRKEDREKGIIFQSTLSTERTEQSDDCTHSIHRDDVDRYDKKDRLLNDSFFNSSPYNFNIIRQ